MAALLLPTRGMPGSYLLNPFRIPMKTIIPPAQMTVMIAMQE